MRRLVLAALAVCSLPVAARADDKPAFTREEVIYGRKFGMALTMDVFKPKTGANGAGVLFCVSGAWFSSRDNINMAFVEPFLKGGYTFFAVVHGSNPKFSIPEVLDDMHRAVRFVRTNATKYGIDGDRLAITGGSAGGHLSLMQGCASREGKADAKDPVERASSRVQCVGCYYPPTDFLNWGEKGHVMLGKNAAIPLGGAFDFRRPDPRTRALIPITDEEEIKKIGMQISPITHITKDDAPTLIVHGTEDPLVPLQQSKAMIDRLKETGVPAELIVKEGGKHDGALVIEYLPKVISWFDKHIGRK